MDIFLSRGAPKGPDGGLFTAESGVLMFKDKPNYESPLDANEDNVYEVTVVAEDPEGDRGDTLDVEVTVVNENDIGKVTLSKRVPRVGIPVKATLEDEDETSNLVWVWKRGDTAILDATSDTYTPTAADLGMLLSVEASYSNSNSNFTDGDATITDLAGVWSMNVMMHNRAGRQQRAARVRGRGTGDAGGGGELCLGHCPWARQSLRVTPTPTTRCSTRWAVLMGPSSTLTGTLVRSR